MLCQHVFKIADAGLKSNLTTAWGTFSFSSGGETRVRDAEAYEFSVMIRVGVRPGVSRSEKNKNKTLLAYDMFH